MFLYFKVFAGEKLPSANALWKLNLYNTSNQKEPYQSNILFYGDNLYLSHKATGCNIYLNYGYKSPATGHAEGVHIILI